MIFPTKHACDAEKITPTRVATGRCGIRGTSERHIPMLCSISLNPKMPKAGACTNLASRLVAKYRRQDAH